MLKKTCDVFGEKSFIQQVLLSDGCNKNAIEYAIEEKKLETVKYLLSFDAAKKAIVSNAELLWRCVFWMLREYDESIASYLLKELELNEEKLKGIQKFEF